MEMKPGKWASSAGSLSLVAALALLALPSYAQPANNSAQPAAQDNPALRGELEAARAQVSARPSDPKAHYGLGECLRRSGLDRQAGAEYLKAVDLDPAYYVAFHELSTIDVDSTQLNEAIQRLVKLEEEKPKDLMLRVALSELLEKQGDYYQGARVLVDMVYQNAVPEKYLPKVNARIHYLLVKTKENHDAEKEKTTTFSEEELDTLPPPLPEATLHKDMTVSKLKESQVMRGVGNAPLLP